jgi:sortase A
MRKLKGGAGLLILACGTLIFGHGALIPFKAALAQQLLNSAWQRSQGVDEVHRPWPWADTWPVARLRIERLGMDQVVLAGANGAALAFGPGHLFRSAAPGEPGNTVIAGHRDTHFSSLRDIRRGDRIDVELPSGETVVYTVRATRIVHESNMSVIDNGGGRQLTLVTCYPFDSIQSGGSRRFIVEADQVHRWHDPGVGEDYVVYRAATGLENFVGGVDGPPPDFDPISDRL